MIPVSVKVGNTAYAVHVVAPSSNRPRYYGRISYNLGSITITQRRADGMLHTFWHELTHAILHDMRHPLTTDEKFVTEFSDRLHRAIKSARF